MFWFGPFDIHRVWYFGIDTRFDSQGPDPLLGPTFIAVRLRQDFGIGRFGIAIDTFGLPSNRASEPSLGHKSARADQSRSRFDFDMDRYFGFGIASIFRAQSPCWIELVVT